MSTMKHRLQILLDEERHDRVLSAARERGVSVATVVRDAIDSGVPRADRRRAEAGRRILEAPDMEVPDMSELQAELDRAHDRF
ncbi:MAG: hypothetical protein M9938_06975 [Solirubrobacterales bacterium]|nr:hypothetical protein [Solirubrobacterales bacterium]